MHARLRRCSTGAVSAMTLLYCIECRVRLVPRALLFYSDYIRPSHEVAQNIHDRRVKRKGVDFVNCTDCEETAAVTMPDFVGSTEQTRYNCPIVPATE